MPLRALTRVYLLPESRSVVASGAVSANPVRSLVDDPLIIGNVAIRPPTA